MEVTFSNNTYIYIMSFIIFPLLVLYGVKFKKEGYNDVFSKKNTDVLRGLSISMIVLHHFSIRMANQGMMKIFVFFGYLGVGMFFFLSGYGLMRSYLAKNNYLDGFIKKKIFRLYTPFFIANTFFLIINELVFNKFYSIKEILTSFITIYSIDAVLLWYIIATIFLYLFFYLSFKFLNISNGIKFLTTSVLIYVIIGRYFNVGTYLYNAILAFPLGIYASLYEEKVSNYIKNNYNITTSVSMLIFIMTFGIYFKRNYLILAIISSLFFILTSFLITYKFELNSRILLFVGSISYEIYITHEAIYYPFYKYVGISKLPYSIFIYLLIAMILSLGLNKLVKRTKLNKPQNITTQKKIEN